MEIINDSGLSPIKSNGVLVYVGDVAFFNKKIGGRFLVATDESISRAISEATEGILIEKGSKAFENDFDSKPEVGGKVSFKGHYGHTYSVKRGTYKSGNQDLINRAYYRIMKDTDIEALVTNK